LKRLAATVESAATHGDVFAFMKHEETPDCVLNARKLLDTIS
jgi:hypothetical protein